VELSRSVMLGHVLINSVDCDVTIFVADKALGGRDATTLLGASQPTTQRGSAAKRDTP